ncbi:unnamed protein product [Schistosoma margrebowiei]|uniref:Uncharacterized protein n=1 Tax=Schistosoma margrebowiei TaxID=48269 RepID=A0A183MVK5_9TREM|nr:unnamed protein product [Schistosoma margrebowiei]
MRDIQLGVSSKTYELDVFQVPDDVAEAELASRKGSTVFQNFIYDLPIPFSLLLLLCGFGYLLIIGIIYAIVKSILANRTPNVKPSVNQLQPFACCPCCLSVADLCNCCRVTSIDACLNGICPQRKTHDFTDLLLCQICLGRPGRMKSTVPLVKCPVCCRSAYCEDTVICCFLCNFRSKALLQEE